MMKVMAKENDKPRCGEPVPDGVFADGVNASCNRPLKHSYTRHRTMRLVNGVWVKVTWGE
jgi:hypothetical protein